MKRMLAAILSLLLIGALLGGCGKDNTPKDPTATTQGQETQEEETREEETRPTTDNLGEDSALHAGGSQILTYEELAMLIPADFRDMTKTSGMGIYDFLFANDALAVCGLKNNGNGQNYMEYAQSIAKKTDNASAVKDRNGYASFHYEASAGAYSFQYEVGVFPSGSKVWLLQVYCQSEEYGDRRKDMVQILDSVQIDASQISEDADDWFQATAGTKPYRYENLTVTVPGNFEDVTEQMSMGVYEFVLCDNDIALMVSKAPSYGMARQTYAQALAAELSISEVEDCGTYAHFTYTNTGLGREYAYEVGVFEDAGQMWIVQVSVLSELHSQYRDSMLEILTCVTLD